MAAVSESASAPMLGSMWYPFGFQPKWRRQNGRSPVNDISNSYCLVSAIESVLLSARSPAGPRRGDVRRSRVLAMAADRHLGDDRRCSSHAHATWSSETRQG